MSAASVLRRAAPWALGLLVACVLVVGVAAAWFGYTASGARQLVALATRAVDLRYATLDGTLARGLDLTGLALRTPGMTLTLDRASFRWRPRALLAGTLAIDRLSLAHGELQLTATDEATDDGLPRVPLPIDIDALDVRDLSVVRGDLRQQIDSLTASLHAADDDYTLRAFTLEAGAHRARGEATLRDGGDALTAEIDYTGALAGDDTTTPLAGRLSVAGPRSRLAVALTLSAPFAATLAGDIDAAADAPTLALRGHAEPTPWLAQAGIAARVEDLAFSLDGNVDTVALRVATTLEIPDQPPLAVTLGIERLPDGAQAAPRAELQWRVRPAEPVLGVADIAGGGELAWNDGRLVIAQTVTEPSPIELTAELVTGAQPRVQLRANWTSLALELGTTTLRSPAGQLALQGIYPALAIAVDARVEEARVGAVDVRLEGQLGDDRFELESLHAALLDGTLDADGSVESLAARRGSFDVALRGIDLARLREDLSTTLDARARLTLAGPRVQLALTDASGRWREHDIAARGDITLDTRSSEIALRDTRLRIGRNRLAVNGEIGQALALDFTLAAPALAEIDAELAGAVHGEGSLRGTSEAPLLNVDLTASALEAGPLRIGQASVQAEVSPTASSTLSVQADRVRAGETTLGTVSLAAAGTLAAHTVTLDVGQGEQRLELRTRGRYVDGRLDGELGRLTLAWPDLGTWRLGDAVAWRYVDGALTLTPLCLAQDAASVCIDAEDLTADAGELHARFTRMPLALAAPWLPPRLAVDGALDGELTATQANGTWQPRGRIDADGLTVTAEASDMRLRAAPLALAFRAVQGGQAFELTAASAELGELSAKGTLRDVDGTRRIDATLRMAALKLEALAALVPALAGSDGQLSLTASVQGPFDAPAVTAKGRLVDGRVKLERLGIVIDDAAFDAAMRTPDRIDLDLSLGQGTQRLRVNGHVEHAPAWPFEFEVSSERFTVLRRAELDVDIAPALTIDGTLEDLRLRGTLDLPLLHVRLQQQPPGAVTVSADEVIIDADGEVVVDEQADPTGLRYYRDHVTGIVRVALGDDAQVTGLGLDADLIGALRFTKEAGSLGFADGRIALQDGEYIAYRQTLEIINGELRFAGPIDNPRIDVLATRPDLEVTAGVRITGTVQSPIVRLYSSPQMADLETLSWVVTGEPLGGTDRTAAGMLSKAAIGLGLEQATGLTDQLRDWFALDELGLSGGDTVEDTSFVAGKQLTPRMKVRSEFNPFDRLWSVFLNYELTKHWSVEGESGARQGADLLYSIERETLF